MARDPSNFEHNSQLSTTAKDLYTPPSNAVKGLVRKLSFFNTSTTDGRTVTVYVVESGGSAGTSNILDTRYLPPQSPWNCVLAQGEVLESGISLQAKQDSGTDVNVNCSGTIAT